MPESPQPQPQKPRKKWWPKVKWISSAHTDTMPWNVVCYEFLLHPLWHFGHFFPPVWFFLFSFLLFSRGTGHKHIRKQFVHAPILLYFPLTLDRLPRRWIFSFFLLFLGSDKQNKEMSGEELKIGNPITRDTNGMPQTKQKKINQRNELPSWKGETLEVLEFFKFFKHTLSHLTKTKKKG